MDIAKIIVVSILSVLTVIFIISPMYFKWGIGKWLYHNIFGWHQPKENDNVSFDGYSFHCKCKHCGKDIMQDSQGNWF